MLRRILIPFDPSPFGAAAIDYGCFLAKRYNAEVTGVVVLDTPGIEKSIGPIPMGGLYYADRLEEKKKKDAHEHIQALLEKFKEKCQREGVAHRESELQGSPSEQILHTSIFYDLVVIGLRTFFHFETKDKPGYSLEHLLSHAVTPVLAVPENYQPVEKRKVLIAFDGSLPSARSLHSFAYFMNSSTFETEITLLMSDTDPQAAKFFLDGAEAFLNAHSFNNIKKEWIQEDIIDTIKEKYLDQTDLVVLGVHSKKGMFDFMVGSLSKFLIKEGTKPLLLGQ